MPHEVLAQLVDEVCERQVLVLLHVEELLLEDLVVVRVGGSPKHVLDGCFPPTAASNCFRHKVDFRDPILVSVVDSNRSIVKRNSTLCKLDRF